MKIKCKCNGMPLKGYICPAVTADRKYCNATFKCRYQGKEDENKRRRKNEDLSQNSNSI